jgi:hypothetical protein
MDFKGKLSKYFFSNGITYLLLVILIEILILKTTMYHKYNFTLKKITPTFETNDEHQAMYSHLKKNILTVYP